MTIKKPAHYVSNSDFLAAIKQYKISVAEAESKGFPSPVIPNYLGECLLKIATHLSYKPNFVNYSYREEMISDGVENCIQYLSNFDPDKSSNPFSYFTQVIWFAFLRRIAKEKKQTYIKGKLIQEIPFDAFELQEHDEEGRYTNSYLDFVQNNSTFETPLELKKEKIIKSSHVSLDEFANE
jgi:hypothetical protein